MGWDGSALFLAESQSRLYPHMRAKFGRDPTVVSKKVPFNFISRYAIILPSSTEDRVHAWLMLKKLISSYSPDISALYDAT